MKKPPFEITNRIVYLIAEIAELVGKLTSTSQLSASPMLRRINRIRTIHGSLAIEQNTLSIDQVTAVIDGKTVYTFKFFINNIPLPHAILGVSGNKRMKSCSNNLISVYENNGITI